MLKTKIKPQIMKKLLFLLVVISLFASCNKDKLVTGELTVSGYLTNVNTPVANAEVDINDLVKFRVKSDTNGFFEIINIPSGTHELNYQVASNQAAFRK
jgi:hypothetical protein